MFSLLIIIAINILIYIFNKSIAQGLNLFDNPDGFRKFHKVKVPLTGGIIIVLNSSLALIFTLAEYLYFDKSIIFKNDLDLIILFISIFIFFFIGFVDDKYSISPNKRFLFITIILFPIIYFSDSLIINKINFSFIDYSFTLPYLFSIFWTVLCFLLFINAINMFDGINYQVGIYSIYISLFFLINNYFDLFFTFLTIGLITFIFLNHKYKSFLGDSGSYLLAFIFGYFFIKIYNQSTNIKVDHIVLFMIIPGIDLIRLFITRIIKNQNPFSPDRNHLHHIISVKFSLIKTNLIIQSLIIIPSILGFYFGFTYIFLLIQIIVYFYFILSFK
jgi:UDP-GlcNAc:undecaprenyl-phosphate/decaprenyl-phosphate GlcNAc-1-phosphate transferase